VLVVAIGGIYALSAIYAACMAVVLIGVRRLGRYCRKASPGNTPTVSVLVAARNEEPGIRQCVASLLNQDYPADRYRVVVVNDRSNDRTGSILEEIATTSNLLTVVHISDDPVGISGKQNALRTGLRYCEGDVILNTDADCIAPETWVRRFAEEFADDVGLVIGVPVCHRKGARVSLFHALQSLDLAYLLNLAVGAAGIGKPASCIGNNMAVRRKALDAVGGYEDMGYALTEDAALIRAVDRHHEWRIAAANVPSAVVVTAPVATVRQLYRQRARWLLGGMDTGSAGVRILYLMLAVHLVLAATPALIWVPALRLPLATALATKIVADFSVAWQATSTIGRRDMLRVFPAFVVYFVAYSAFIGVGSLFRPRIEWKGQVYGRRR